MSSTLFERLGGTAGISAIVDDVVEEHMNNPNIKSRFLPYREQHEKMAMIKQHTIAFFTVGSGGPGTYAGRDMVTTHRGMNISPAEYMHTVDDILNVLEKHQIDQDTRTQVLGILWSLKGMIIGQ